MWSHKCSSGISLYTSLLKVNIKRDTICSSVVGKTNTHPQDTSKTVCTNVTWISISV